jgi:hypothetical protein
VGYDDSMSQIGQGLIDQDREHEMIADSYIFNAWGMRQ